MVCVFNCIVNNAAHAMRHRHATFTFAVEGYQECPLLME